MLVKGWYSGWVEAGRTGREGRVYGYWLQLIPDGSSTVQLPSNAELWTFLATSWSRSQPSLVPDLPFCKDPEAELAGRVPIVQVTRGMGEQE